MVQFFYLLELVTTHDLVVFLDNSSCDGPLLCDSMVFEVLDLNSEFSIMIFSIRIILRTM